MIAIGLVFLAQPQLFLFFARFVPEGIHARIQTLIDAVAAYRGKAGLLIQAAALGVGTHAFNNLIYVCAARALGVELSLGEVFFASSLQILATLIPASINGIGPSPVTGSSSSGGCSGNASRPLSGIETEAAREYANRPSRMTSISVMNGPISTMSVCPPPARSGSRAARFA